ncbi:MAG: DUF1553 domain-containing protein, partial [Planctomycetaceae bacterium]
DPLSDHQIGLIRAWIDQGAPWPDGVGAQIEPPAKHWAYLKPQRPLIPASEPGRAAPDRADTARLWIRNPIDAFILSKLRDTGLTPSPQADRAMLMRRLSFDLTGLPPTWDEVEAFVHDKRPDAYERLVERLLQSRGAQWIVDPSNPLTARVFVNRLWALCFGQGIVATRDDFGSQGARPTHPDLLDWLAVEFMESGWNVRHVLRLIVTSATYRRSAEFGMRSAELANRPHSEHSALRTPHSVDPQNHLFWRQNIRRLDAEMVRDQALAVSGLLVEDIGGRSVKPYQPDGYWKHLNFPKREWRHDAGRDQYRRGLYTYWCRTFLHPSLGAFDAPTREECTVERPRSNTPLQALVLLNDPTYVEAARALAERILRDGGTSPDERIAFAYRQCLSREPRPEEATLLAALVARHLEQYRADGDAAKQTNRVGLKPAPDDLDPAELAAWTGLARV